MSLDAMRCASCQRASRIVGGPSGRIAESDADELADIVTTAYEGGNNRLATHYIEPQEPEISTPSISPIANVQVYTQLKTAVQPDKRSIWKMLLPCKENLEPLWMERPFR